MEKERGNLHDAEVDAPALTTKQTGNGVIKWFNWNFTLQDLKSTLHLSFNLQVATVDGQKQQENTAATNTLSLDLKIFKQLCLTRLWSQPTSTISLCPDLPDPNWIKKVQHINSELNLYVVRNGRCHLPVTSQFRILLAATKATFVVVTYLSRGLCSIYVTS